MTLIACRECSHTVSDEAAACPHCGAKTNREGFTFWLKALGIGAIFTFAFIAFANYGKHSPEIKAEARDRDAIRICLDQAANPALEPSASRFAYEACDHMKNDFLTKFGKPY